MSGYSRASPAAGRTGSTSCGRAAAAAAARGSERCGCSWCGTPSPPATVSGPDRPQRYAPPPRQLERDQPPVLHLEDDVGLGGDVGIVSGDYHRPVLPSEAAQQLYDEATGLRVEICRRLIGDDDGRLVGQRPG